MRASVTWCPVPWVEVKISQWHPDFMGCFKEAAPIRAWDGERKVWLVPADKLDLVLELLESFGAGDVKVQGKRLEVAGRPVQANLPEQLRGTGGGR